MRGLPTSTTVGRPMPNSSGATAQDAQGVSGRIHEADILTAILQVIIGISQSMISSRRMVLEEALCIPLSPVLSDLGASAQHSTK